MDAHCAVLVLTSRCAVDSVSLSFSSVDQRELHQCTPNQPVPLSALAELGVLYWSLDPAGLEADPYSGELGRIRKERSYKNHDIITVSPDKLPNYEAKIKSFFEEHLHEDEEIRCTIEGQGFFDVRSDRDQSWIRILVQAGDMIVLPAGMYHRFTLDTSNYIKVIRLFQDAPRWEAINRGEKAEHTKAREVYLKFNEEASKQKGDGAASSPSASSPSAGVALSSTHTSGPNGESWILNEAGAKSIANYPHLRAFGGALYVSGISSRRPDNTHEGATLRADGSGSFDLDVAAQTHAVLTNIARILSQAGAGLEHIVDLTVFLVNMDDYAKMNAVYNRFFPDPAKGPTRTTVAVKQLPHPNLLVEIKCVAADPRKKQ